MMLVKHYTGYIIQYIILVTDYVRVVVNGTTLLKYGITLVTDYIRLVINGITPLQYCTTLLKYSITQDTNCAIHVQYCVQYVPADHHSFVDSPNVL